VVNETLIFNDAGRLVTRGRTHQSFLLPEHAGAAAMAVDKSREHNPARSFKVGERGGEPVESRMINVSEAMCMAFSGPARNYHTDRNEARKLGFPEIVVQGMLSVCLVGAMMTRRFGVGFLCGGRFDLRLVNVLWANETTAARGRILERRPEGARTRAEVETWCEKSDGTKTVVGTASALDPRHRADRRARKLHPRFSFSTDPERGPLRAHRARANPQLGRDYFVGVAHPVDERRTGVARVDDLFDPKRGGGSRSLARMIHSYKKNGPRAVKLPGRFSFANRRAAVQLTVQVSPWRSSFCGSPTPIFAICSSSCLLIAES
jgi:acyl dehydratase